MELEQETPGETGTIEEVSGDAITPKDEVVAEDTPGEDSAAVATEGKTGDDELGDVEGEHKQPPRGVQKRIDELTKEKHEWRREADYWRELATKEGKKAEEDVAAQKPPNEAVSDVEPNSDNFEDFKDYVKELGKWQVRQELKASRAEAVREQIQLERIRQRQTAEQSFKAAAEKTAEKYTDFREVVTTSKAPCTDHMLNAMQESPQGPELMYYLAKNPTEADRIAGLSPYGQVRELGLLEAKLSEIKPLELRRITRTSEPTRTVSGANVAERDPNKMSMDDYAKWRRSQSAG